MTQRDTSEELATIQSQLDVLRAQVGDDAVREQLDEISARLSRLRLEGRVGEREELLESLLENAVDAVVIIDEFGIIEWFSREAVEQFGYEVEEAVGRNVSMLMPSPHAEQHDDYLERYRRGGEAHIIGIGREVEAKRRDGTTFPVDLAVSELQVGGRRVYLGMLRDITERRRARRELESKNAELERFTYTVSHDLKSPLITIKGFLGMLERDAVAGNIDRLRSDIERIGNAADKMKQLLDEVLELSRIGRVVHPPERIDLGEMASEVVALLSASLEERGATVEIAEDMPSVRGDRVRLREVLQNLIENALKFSGEQPSPRIEIDARALDDRVECRVRDNGQGIDARHIDKVFGLFEQLDPHREGSGVGLALVHRIIEYHGGEIWVESEGLGQGATFIFTLPRG